MSTDTLGRYYTNDAVGGILASHMGLKSPRTVIDLGCGNGALSVEASKRWKAAKFITVDVDSAAELQRSIVNNCHYVQDVLNSQLHSRIGIDLRSVDGALCNPPFIRPAWRKDFGAILEDAGLSGVFPSIRDVGAEVLFIAQNLRFLRDFGRLGLILPDSLIAGEKYKSFRKNLITQHRIEKVIELPRRIFQKTDAKAHIVIITKAKRVDDFIMVGRLGDDGLVPKNLEIPVEAAIQRLDYSYLETQRTCSKKSGFTLGDVCTSLVRGHINSAEVRASRVPIFHSTDFPVLINNKCPTVPATFSVNEKQTKLVNTELASVGDILICRVGRNLEKKICKVGKGEIAISDCVYKLHVKKEYRKRTMDFLCSPKGQNRLKTLAHGVGAKYLSRADLLELVIEEGN